MPIPIRSDRSAHDDIDYPALHSKDLDLGTPIHHLPTVLPDELARFDGDKWIGFDLEAWLASKQQTTVPASLTVNTGTLDAGTYADLAAVGGTDVAISEVTGTPGFNVTITFSGITLDPTIIVLYGRYAGSATHEVHLEILNNSTAQWDVLGEIVTNAAKQWYGFPIYNGADYYPAGVATVRIRHVSPGNPSHDLYLDYLAISHTFGSGGAAAHDQAADEVPVDASGFTGNLSAADTNVQLALNTIDAMVAGGASALDDLTDVNAPAPTDGQVLTWDDGGAAWIAADPTGGSGSGGADLVWHFDGTLVAAEDCGGAHIVPRSGSVAVVKAYVKTPGTAGSTVVDVKKNGTSIFTSKPTIAFDDADKLSSVVPTTQPVSENDIFTIDIDSVATGAKDLVVIISFEVTGGTSGVDTLLELTDAPDSYTGQANKLVAVKGTEDGVEFITPATPGSTTFLGLTDTPADYTDDALKYVRVNAGADALEFQAFPAIPADFTDLADVPSVYTGQGGKVVAVKSSVDGLEFITLPSGVTTFLGLSDTPSSYSGQGLKPVRVNSGADALEFYDIPRQQVVFTIEGDVAVGTGDLYIGNHTGRTLTIVGVYLRVKTAPTGAALIVDIHKDDTTIFTTQSNRPQIAAGATTGNSTTVEVSSWGNGTYLSMDRDQVGSTITGANLSVVIVYY